jgi:two-component system, chemotaxis family, sensor kinase CheA
MDPWLSLCEDVDTRLNRLAIDASVGTPAEALDAVQTGLRALAKTLKRTLWPDIGDVAKQLDQVASEITSADEISAALAHVQGVWQAYQHHLVGEVVPTSSGGAVASAPVSEPAATAEGDDSEDLDVLRSDPELATMFISEALDHLSTIEATVLELESNPTDQKLLNDVFRPFHTVKGNAGALSVKSVQAFAHKVENLLDLARSGDVSIGAEEIEVILKSVDMLTSMITGLNARLGGHGWEDRRAERASLVVQIERVTGSGATPGSPAGTMPAASSSDLSFSEPASASAEPLTGTTSAPPTPTPLSDLPKGLADIIAAVQSNSLAPTQKKSEPAKPAEQKPAPVAETKPEAKKTETAPEATQAPAAAARATEAAPAAGGAAPPQRRADDTVNAVKVDTRKLDSLVDMVGELVIVQSLIAEDPAVRAADERLSRNLAQLTRLASDLQRNAMSMRMMPVRPTFQKMARLVRDLSKKSGKPVELVLSGEDTELDRKVVEEINDPLMHMIRNSVDHGIETPDQRKKAGKTPVGRLSLSASHQGGNIVIAIVDDGGGLNADKILKKAIAQGLVQPGQQLPLSEIHQLIFRPGFSTAEKVTEISGRGVGMDVVRRNIEALRGRIEIQSEQGKGTTFLIKLPLTLAIVEGLLLRVGQERFVMPTFSIRESLRPQPERVHSVQGVPRMIQVRDSLLPLVSLAQLFNIPDAITNPCESTAVVMEDDGRFVAVMVDQLVGKQEVVIKSLGPAFAGIRGVAGGAILGDGRIGLILDAGGLMGMMEHSAAA